MHDHYGEVGLLHPPKIVDRPWEHFARLFNPKDEFEEAKYLREPADTLNLSFDKVPTPKLTICILMPNGTVIAVEMCPSATFFELKEEVFELAQRGPMYGALRDPKSYRFNYVDFSSAASKDVDDEEIRLCDAQPFGGFIKLLKTKEDTASLELDEQIGQLIGKPLKEFDALRNAEVNEFRYKMRSLCEDIVKMRQNHNWLDKMKYAYPMAHEPSLEVPKYLLRRIPADGCINIKVSFEKPAINLDLNVHHMFTPDEILTAAMRKLMTEPAYSTAFQQLMAQCEADSYYDTSFETDNPAHLGTTYFLLKINGCLEYLYDCPPGSRNKQLKLIQYKTVRNMLLNDQTVQLVAVWKNTIEFEDESIYSVPDFLPVTPRTRSQSTISLGSLTSVLLNAKRRHTTFSSWSVDRKLVIRIHSASRITYGTDINRIALMAGIFHGGELLVEHYMTTPTSESGSLAKSAPNLVMLDTTHSSFTWDNDIVFNLKVSDLPRMARLCFSVVGFSGNSGNSKKLSKSQSVAVLAAKPTAKLFWGNINFYDYKGILRENSTTLCLWPFDDEEVCDDANSSDSDEAFGKYFNPLGTVVQNPAVAECPLLTISFTKYSEGDNAIIKYPEMKEISRSYASQPTLNSFPEERSEDADFDSAEVQTDPEEEDTFEVPPIRRCASASSASSVRTAWARKQSLAIEKVDVPEPRLRASLTKGHASKQFLKQISDFCDRDLLYRMTDQECELLMLLREDCRRAMPNALNKLLLSFKWNQQKSVGQVLTLLNDWPKISPSKALELLDYAYPDSFVRHYAVECLKDMNSEQLSHFLLQLVQALKYESYIYNDLVQFLLERAFENQRIGHQLFWLLRAEMHDPAVSVHFGLILEAYCRGAVDHIHVLAKQIECISKLRRINEIIREDKSRDSRDKKIFQMQEILKQKYYQETLTNVINPLDPAYKLGVLRINKCKFMDSKMKPLWLVFENADKAAQDIYLMFKNGDDLRQDMLTLQMIRIMDYMWKEEGLDLRMTPYKCVSLAKNVGLIEVVLNADTIANIQKEKGSAALAAFKKGSIYSWLKDHNPGESLKNAVEEFTLSCAGYCVATYVLGIADRHNDNIMVKKNGQLFHIDFGHILGKFKEKFGIRRERVPFVLTHDFVYVITHGGQDKNTEHFSRFQSVCEQAFLIIRRRGNFIISLFAMMLSTGIPEVSSVDDLQYLRETLVLDLSEDHARTHFRAKFTEALKNSWKTSFNWCAHSLAKDNRMTENQQQSISSTSTPSSARHHRSTKRSSRRSRRSSEGAQSSQGDRLNHQGTSTETPNEHHRHHRRHNRHHRRHRNGPGKILVKYLSNVARNSLHELHNSIQPTMSVYYQNIHEYLQEVNQNQQNQETNNQMPPSPAVHFNRPPPPPPAEMHEFISDIAPNTIPQPRYNPYAPPPPRNGLFPLTDFLQDPLNAGLSTLTKVAAIARSPTQMINHAATGAYHLIHQNTNSIFRPPGQAERVFPGSGPSSIVQDPFNSMEGEEGVPAPPPVLPLINCTVAQNRLEPLTAAELVGKTWTKEELAVRVFKGGVAEDNKLRAQLYPILLGLAKDLDNDAPVADYVFDWSKLESLYQHYENQWKAILPEQERRFALFRERKSLIERDVIRCDRTHPYYEGDTKSLELLKNLLLTYMMYDFDTGYVQGMSDLASPLLYVAEGKVDHAFWFFSQVMDFTHNNFEMSQMTIKLQLDMLWKLIELTDPIFAQYLANNDSVNCYFAFRWIVCQFKRELMKTNCDGYDDILKLWETIWTCNSMRRHLMKLKEEQKAKEGKEETKSEEKNDSEETIGTAQSTSAPTSFSDSTKPLSLKDLTALEKERESAELVAAMAGSCKIEDSADTSNAQVVLDPSKLETPPPAAMSGTSTSEEEGEEETSVGERKAPESSGSSASSRPSVGVSAVNLNVYVPEVKRLTDSELYVLCICLCIIRRERDLIMANRFDATEILKHFNTLQFTLNLKDILLHAANIWSWLVYDEKEELLYASAGDSSSAVSSVSELGAQAGTAGSVGSMSAQHGSSVADSSTSTTARNEADDFDLLPDARISTISGEDYFLMN